jgi:hypothetical protein
MNHTDRFTCLVKLASPRWAKMLADLSLKSRSRLVHSLPAGQTRQIGRKELGHGVEGRVMPGFTGGHGPSAIKQFYNNPYAVQQNMAGKGITSRGLPTPLGDASIAERVAMMRAHPDIFPKVLGQNPRGYVVERLTDMPLASPGVMIRKFLEPTTSTSPTKLSDVMGSWREGLSLLASPKKTFWDWLNARGAAKQLNSRLRSSSSLRLRNPVDVGLAELAVPSGNRYFVEDFGRSAKGKWHNVMRTNTGRSVISDPLLTRQFAPKSTAGDMATRPMYSMQ